MLDQITEELQHRFELVVNRLEALKKEQKLLTEEYELLFKIITHYQCNETDVIEEARKEIFKSPDKEVKLEDMTRAEEIRQFEQEVIEALRQRQPLGWKDVLESTSACTKYGLARSVLGMRLARMVDTGKVVKINKLYHLPGAKL